jgi:hypothetical protein
MKMEQTECSEMSAYKIQATGNYREENLQHSEHGESLKSRIPEVLSVKEQVLGWTNARELQRTNKKKIHIR